MTAANILIKCNRIMKTPLTLELKAHLHLLSPTKWTGNASQHALKVRSPLRSSNRSSRRFSKSQTDKTSTDTGTCVRFFDSQWQEPKCIMNHYIDDSLSGISDE